MERRTVEPTFLDMAVADLGSPKTKQFLELVDQHVPWAKLAAPCKVFYGDKPKAAGRPHWPLVTMVKVMMLRKWYGLSDVQAEEQIRDRISFRQFLKLSLSDATPDHSTIRLFNERLRESGLCSELFDGVLEHMRTQGLVIEEGCLIDATIYQTSRGSKRKDGTKTTDRGATKTAKGNLPYNGFRAHVKTNVQGVIGDYRFDTARVSEHTYFESLVGHERKAVYADAGYMKKARSEELKGRGIFPGIMHRRVRAQKELTAEQKAHNKKCAKIRAAVEHPFGWMKNMGHRIRYRGVSNNGADFAIAAAAYNLKRMLSLMGKALSGKSRPASGRLLHG